MSEDEQPDPEAIRPFLDELARATEHEDITIVEALRRMCEAAITVYDGSDDQRVADWARQVLRGLDERGS